MERGYTRVEQPLISILYFEWGLSLNPHTVLWQAASCNRKNVRSIVRTGIVFVRAFVPCYFERSPIWVSSLFSLCSSSFHRKLTAPHLQWVCRTRLLWWLGRYLSYWLFLKNIRLETHVVFAPVLLLQYFKIQEDTLYVTTLSACWMPGILLGDGVTIMNDTGSLSSRPFKDAGEGSHTNK